MKYDRLITNLMIRTIAEQKNEKKRELAKRLVEINARKREERLTEDRQKLEKLINIKKCHDRGETKEYQKQMRQNMISNRDELEVMNPIDGELNEWNEN